jgi:dienelactone hydrolase
MHTQSTFIAALLSMLITQPVTSDHVELPPGMSQVQATWLWGHHSIPGHITGSGTPYWYVYPHTDINAITNPVWSDVAAAHIKPGAKAPAVLVLHGCSGISYGATEYRRYFIGTGFAIFEPNSYARPGRISCDEDLEASFRMRTEELQHALTEIRKLDWVDQSRLLLLGISEGGAVAAARNGDDFAAHIIFEASCWAQKGRIPAAAKTVPVFAAVGEKDKGSNGASCNTNSHAPGSHSMVLKDAPHSMYDEPEVGAALIKFLTTTGLL